MSNKFELGKLYKIRFYDHCIGMSRKMECEVCGWIIKEDKEHIVLTYWRVNDSDATTVRENIEPVSIIKSCITRKRKLA